MTRKARVSKKGQVTIPKDLRDRLGIRPGQELELHESNGKRIVTKQNVEDAVGSVYGVLGLNRRTDELITSLRSEVDNT